MKTKELKLRIYNGGTSVLSVDLEIEANECLVPPKEAIIVHAICSEDVEPATLELHWFETGLSIYPPGRASQCIDFFVTLNGVRIAPISG